jgi:hypothetical protein
MRRPDRRPGRFRPLPLLHAKRARTRWSLGTYHSEIARASIASQGCCSAISGLLSQSWPVRLRLGLQPARTSTTVCRLPLPLLPKLILLIVSVSNHRPLVRLFSTSSSHSDTTLQSTYPCPHRTHRPQRPTPPILIVLSCDGAVLAVDLLPLTRKLPLAFPNHYFRWVGLSSA